MKTTTALIMAFLMVATTVLAVDCINYDWQSKLISPTKGAYIVTDRPSWTSYGYIQQNNKQCRIYPPTAYELLKFMQTTDYTQVQYKGASVFVQRDFSFDVKNAVQTKNVYGYGLYWDIGWNNHDCIGNKTSRALCENKTKTVKV